MNTRHKLLIPVAYLLFLMCGFYLSMYQITLLQIAKTFSLSNYMMGILVAVQCAGGVIPPLFLGSLSEKIGKRGVILISMPMMILGAFLISAAQTLTILMIGMFVYSSGAGVSQGTYLAVLGAEYKKKSMFLLSICQALFSIGAVAGSFIFKTLMSSGLKYFILFRAVSVILFILYLLFILTNQQNDTVGEEGAGIIAAFRFFKNKVFLLIALALMMYVGTETMLTYFTDSFFNVTLGISNLSALAISLFWGGMIPSRLSISAIRLNLKSLMLLCTAGILISIAAFFILPSPSKVYAFFAMGVFCGPLWPLIMNNTVKQYPENAGTVSNILISVGSFGGAAAPAFAGLFFTGKDFSPAFTAAAFLAIGMLLFFSSALRKAPDKNT